MGKEPEPCGFEGFNFSGKTLKKIKEAEISSINQLRLFAKDDSLFTIGFTKKEVKEVREKLNNALEGYDFGNKIIEKLKEADITTMDRLVMFLAEDFFTIENYNFTKKEIQRMKNNEYIKAKIDEYNEKKLARKQKTTEEFSILD